jgi:hypothetical protein
VSAEWRPARRHGLKGDLAVVAGVVAGAEECHDERGWDMTPPVVYVLTRNAPPARTLVDMSRGVVGLSMTPVNEPGDLARIAWLLETGTETERAGFDPPGEPLAHVFLAEGYRAGTTDPVPAGRDLADVPGSIETRFAVAIVGAADVIYLRRDRGGRPEILHTSTDAGPPDRLGGEHIYPGLVRIHAAARRLHGLAT